MTVVGWEGTPMDGWYAEHDEAQGYVIRGTHEEPEPPPRNESAAQWVAAERLDRPDLAPPERGTELAYAPEHPAEAEPFEVFEDAPPDPYDYGYDYVDGTIQAGDPGPYR